MEKIYLIVALLGVLILFLLGFADVNYFSGEEIDGQNFVYQGVVAESKIKNYGTIFLIEGNEFFCDCSLSLEGKKIFLHGEFEEFDSVRRNRVISLQEII